MHTNAADENKSSERQVEIPFDKETKTTTQGGKIVSTAIPNYISALYQFAIYAAAILAVVMIMVGGFLWLTSAGNQSQVGRAREYISSAFIGLLLALGSYLILYTINPSLTQLKGIPLLSPSKATGLSANTSCEELAAKGFTITPLFDGEPNCDLTKGAISTGAVSDFPKGVVFHGTECTYNCKTAPFQNVTYCNPSLTSDKNNYECTPIPLVDKPFSYCVWQSCDFDGPDLLDGALERNGACSLQTLECVPLCAPDNPFCEEAPS